MSESRLLGSKTFSGTWRPHRGQTIFISSNNGEKNLFLKPSSLAQTVNVCLTVFLLGKLYILNSITNNSMNSLKSSTQKLKVEPYYLPDRLAYHTDKNTSCSKVYMTLHRLSIYLKTIHILSTITVKLFNEPILALRTR